MRRTIRLIAPAVAAVSFGMALFSCSSAPPGRAGDSPVEGERAERRSVLSADGPFETAEVPGEYWEHEVWMEQSTDVADGVGSDLSADGKLILLLDSIGRVPASVGNTGGEYPLKIKLLSHSLESPDFSSPVVVASVTPLPSAGDGTARKYSVVFETTYSMKWDMWEVKYRQAGERGSNRYEYVAVHVRQITLPHTYRNVLEGCSGDDVAELVSRAMKLVCGETLKVTVPDHIGNNGVLD